MYEENTLFVCRFDLIFGFYWKDPMGKRETGAVQVEPADAQSIIWICLQFWSVTEAWLPKGKQWSCLLFGISCGYLVSIIRRSKSDWRMPELHLIYVPKPVRVTRLYP